MENQYNQNVSIKANFIFFKKNPRIIISLNEVLAIEANGKYPFLTLKDKSIKTPLPRGILEDFIKILPKHFIKINKSQIINLKKVVYINCEEVVFKTNKSLKLKYSNTFEKLILGELLKQ